MNDNEFQTIGLYDHNADSYRKVRTAFSSLEDVVGIVHATGTGKSYNALQLAYDNKGKKIVYVVPSNGIIEHIKKIIEDNPNLDLKRDFPNLEFRTYHSFISLSEDEIRDIECDLLILDEFHHIGAPIWGARINSMITSHSNMKIFGMTAYTVRERGKANERDMADPNTDEIFSNRIVSRYDLCDAMIDGVLPKPIYKSAYINLMGLASKLEERVKKLNATSKEYQEYMDILASVKKRIHEAASIPDILRKNIKPNGKYIYFCPPSVEDGTDDIETIKKQSFEWFKQFVPEEDIVFYTSTSDMGEYGRHNREAFYDDVTLDGEQADNKLRIMFAVNQYNEGIHAPNIDGVIMGRGTTSDIIYFEQLGRALSVRGNTKDKFEELEKYSIEKLIAMCKSRDIPIKENSTKEELIEKLIAPIVIDLINNYEFIKKLESDLRDRIKKIESSIERNSLGNHRDIKIQDATFDIEIANQDLFEMLMDISNGLTRTWEDYYELAKAYYEHHGDLLIPHKFKTTDGFSYDENGRVNLGNWIVKQRVEFTNLSQDKQRLLKSIGFVLNVWDDQWQKNFELAKAYYEHHGDLAIPYNFKTTDGFSYDEDGRVNLGIWITHQRVSFSKLLEDKQELLKSIGFVLNTYDDQWQKNFELAKAYYEHYGDLLIPYNFKTTDGFSYDENGIVNLGSWIVKQRVEFTNLSQDKQRLLKSIGFVLNVWDDQWQKNFKLAKAYYEHHGDLAIPYNFKTTDGFSYDENGRVNLGNWIRSQRARFSKLSEDKKELLISLGFVVNIKKNKEAINDLCEQYSIDEVKNKTILSHISIQELQSKIEFLKANNMPLVDENGLLVDIFNMSSPNMKEKYGISLDELISEYYIKRTKE